MSGSNGGNGRVETSGLAHVAAAEGFARAAVAAFGSCEVVGAPLSDAQKIAILEAMLCEFDGFSARLSSLARVEQMLRGLGRG